MKKTVLIIFAAILGIVYLFYALGFTLQLIGFFIAVSERGFRQTLCGTNGCSDFEYISSVLWLCGVTIITYIAPIFGLIYFMVRRRKKG